MRNILILPTRSLVRRLLTKQVTITVSGTDEYGDATIQSITTTVPRNRLCAFLISHLLPFKRIRGIR